MEIINQSNFNEKVQNGVVLVDFFATWCGPCKMVAPILEKVAAEYEGKVSIFKVDVDQDPGLAGMFGVQAIPTMVLFKDGQPVKTNVGFMAKPQIEEFFKDYL